MKKKILTFFMMVAIIGASLCAFVLPASAATAPVLPESVNLALGRTAEFKNHDLSAAVEMLNYNPSLTESGKEVFDSELKYNTITDGNLTWDWFAGVPLERTAMGVNATAADTQAWVTLDLGKTAIIDKIGVGYLGGLWIFENVVIQVAEQADFSDAYTVFSTEETVSFGSDVVYSGGIKVDGAEKAEDIWKSPFTGRWYVNSANEQTRNYCFMQREARYVRYTNLHKENEGANHTLLSELAVWGVTEGIAAPSSSLPVGSYSAFSAITLGSLYDGANIYYTLDGSYPTELSILYTAPIDVSLKTESFTLRTMAKLSDGSFTAVKDYAYTYTGNIALKKSVEMKSFDTFESVEMYNFDAAAISEFSHNSITDGDLTWGGGASKMNCSQANTQAWAVIDLGKSYNVDSVGIALIGGMWTFNSVVIQVAQSADFSDAVTVFSTVTEPYGLVLAGLGNDETKEGSDYVKWNTFANWWYVLSRDNNTVNFNFEAVQARYVRATNRVDADVHANNQTIFSEITVTGRSEQPVLSKAVKSIDAQFEGSEFVYGTALADVTKTLPAEAQLTLTDNGQQSAVISEWKCVSWTSGNADAAKYTFTATLVLPDGIVNPYGVTLEREVKVNKAANVLAWTSAPANKSYDSLAVTAAASATNGTPSVKYYKKSGSTFNEISVAPVDAGTYKAVASVSESSNYLSAELTKEFTIAKASPSVSVTYIGKELTTASEFPRAEDFTVNSGTITGKLTLATATLAEGTNEIEWTFTPENANYNEVKGKVSIDVKKAPEGGGCGAIALPDSNTGFGLPIAIALLGFALLFTVRLRKKC